jgi:hypothetical protein
VAIFLDAKHDLKTHRLGGYGLGCLAKRVQGSAVASGNELSGTVLQPVEQSLAVLF